MKNAPETARGRKPPKPQILDNLPRKSGALSLGRRRPTVASTTISHVRRGSSPNREAAAPPRFRSADMTADRSGGTSTGSLCTGRSSTVRQCYYRRCSIRLRLRGYTHHGGTHRSAMGLLSSVDACMPRHTGIQSTQDRPASTRQAPTKTGAQARYHDTLAAALQQPTTPAWTGRHCLHNPVTRRTSSQPADQGGCTVDITAGGR